MEKKFHDFVFDYRQFYNQYEKKNLSILNSQFDLNKPRSIIIDNGSNQIKAGFSNFSEPGVVLKSMAGKLKVQMKGGVNEIFGEEILKTDPGKFNKKTPFEKNLLLNIQTQESLFDQIFKSLQIKTSSVNYPVVITEPFLNLSYCRKALNELLFESYSVPSVLTAVDFMLSAYQNLENTKDYLAISSGYNTTLVVPVLNGKPLHEYSKRLSIGGFHHADYLMKTLQLKYPNYKNKFTIESCTYLQENYTECAIDYSANLKKLETLFLEEQNRIKEEELKTLYGSLDIYNKVLQKEINSRSNFQVEKNYLSSIYCSNPKNLYGEYNFVSSKIESADNYKNLTKSYKNKTQWENSKISDESTSTSELKLNSDYRSVNSELFDKQTSKCNLNFLKWPEDYIHPILTEEDIKKRQEMRQEQGKRLKELLAQKREQKLIQNMKEYDELKQILHTKNTYEKEDWKELLHKKNLQNEEELIEKINMLQSKISIKEEKNEEEEEIDEDKKWPLVNVPDEDLDETQKKQKRIQKLQKHAYYIRLEKKFEKDKEKEEIERLKNEDPENYLLSLFLRKKKILEKINSYQKMRRELLNRRSKVNLSRMMVMAELGNNQKQPVKPQRSKREKKDISYANQIKKKIKKKKDEEEDDFGVNDDDWDVYRGISKHNLSEEEEEEKNNLEELEGDIIDVYPEYQFKSIQAENKNYLSEFYRNCYLGVDQFRGCELIFQPNIIGHEQSGLAEILEIVLSFFSKEDKKKLLSNVFLTGGNMSYKNIDFRIYKELRGFSDIDHDINVVKALDCSLDAWRGGAKLYNEQGTTNFVTKSEYEEKGYEYIKENDCSNRFLKTYS